MKSLKKRSKKNGFVVSTITIIILLIITGIFLSACEDSKVKENVIIEAGTPIPDIKEFFIDSKTAGHFVTDTSVIDTNKIGNIEIELEIGGKKFTTVLTIEDTIPPTGKPVELYIFNSGELNPDAFVTDIYDETQVTCSFAAQPDYNKFDWQNITVILTDEGGNTTNINSRIYIFDVIDEFEVEAGTAGNISIQDFILNLTETADVSLKYINEIDFSKPGNYSVILSCENYEFPAAVKIQDTIPPTGEPVELYVFKNNEINPDDLVTNIVDMTQVTCSFATQPDLTKSNWQDVTVILTDEGGNSTKIKSKLYVFDVIDELVIEAGTVSKISIKDFLCNYIEAEDLSFIQNDEINFSVPGSYSVTLKSGKYETQTVVKIQDTTPPAASVKSCWTYKNKPISVTDFVYNIKDISPVTVKYKTEPDFSVQGNQTVYIILEDLYNNISEYKTELTVISDTTPPVISGELDKRVVVGGTISYRSGITVTDDYDTNVQLVIDSSQVNLNKAGTYTVIYSATDESGNKAEVNGTVIVSAIDMALVNELADGILAKIINNSMNQREKAKAIYNWVNAKMKYSASLSPREIAQAAYNCFTKGAGDCYTYMAASQVLLTRAGIKNKTVQRIPEAETTHYWNLVNTGNGWYHFDVCPTPGNAVTINQRFMFTESQAKKYTQTLKDREHYYDYDKSTVPEVVE